MESTIRQFLPPGVMDFSSPMAPPSGMPNFDSPGGMPSFSGGGFSNISEVHDSNAGSEAGGGNSERNFAVD